MQGVLQVLLARLGFIVGQADKTKIVKVAICNVEKKSNWMYEIRRKVV